MQILRIGTGAFLCRVSIIVHTVISRTFRSQNYLYLVGLLAYHGLIFRDAPLTDLPRPKRIGDKARL